jgi:WXG100 family type VII secretion target
LPERVIGSKVAIIFTEDPAMSAPKIRADYEGLQRIAQSLTNESDQIASMTKNVQSQVDTLRGGDWVGPGATAFYQEMDSSVFPSLKRLGAALDDAAKGAARIRQGMRQAETDAAAALRATGAGDARQKDGDPFAGVSVHNQGSASAQGAGAYASGNDIAFGPGQYAPGNKDGQDLIAHELPHVLQQREGRSNPAAPSSAPGGGPPR